MTLRCRYKLALSPASFSTRFSRLTRDEQGGEDEINLPGRLQHLLLDFSTATYADLPRLTEVLWAVARAAEFYVYGFASCPVFFETQTINHAVEILGKSDLAPNVRMGAVVLLSTIFEDMTEDAQSALANHPMLESVVELTFSADLPMHVCKAAEFLCRLSSVSETARDSVLSFLNLPAFLELTSNAEVLEIRHSFIQLIAFLCYYSLGDEFAELIIAFLTDGLQKEELHTFYAEKLIEALYYVANAGRVKILTVDTDTLDVFPVLLQRGSEKAVWFTIKLLNLLVDFSDEPVPIAWDSLLQSLLSESRKIAIASIDLVQVLLTKTGDCLRIFSPKRLLQIMARGLEDQAFKVRLHLLQFLGFLIKNFGMADGIVKAQILQKIDFSVFDSDSEIVAVLLAIVHGLFSQTEDPGVLISIWNQFQYSHGYDFVNGIKEEAALPHLRERAEAVLALIDSRQIAELPDIGGELLESSDDGVFDGDAT
jgi:hypothetical protein